LILGGDGYLGWPSAMYLSESGHTVAVLDSMLHRIQALAGRIKRDVIQPQVQWNHHGRQVEQPREMAVAR
jgi:nucleoside-diphosphate-sugar epimerase